MSNGSLTERQSRRFLIAVTFLIVTAVLSAAWIAYQENQVQKTVYAKILQQSLETTQHTFKTFISPFRLDLKTLSSWHRSGILDVADSTSLKAIIAPLLNAKPQIASCYLIPAAGPSWRLYKANGAWYLESVPASEHLRNESTWYDNALETDQGAPAMWTTFVTLPADGRPGLVSYVASGDLVLALALLEEDLDHFTTQAPISENGIFFRRYPGGEIAWLTPRFSNQLKFTPGPELQTSGVPEHGVIAKALLEWGQNGRQFESPFRFKRDGQAWWCSLFPSQEGGLPGEMGLLMPADDLASRLETITGTTFYVLIGVVAMSMIVVLVLAFDYRRRWRRFVIRRRSAPETETGLLQLIDQGESHALEFKSTMRWNLRAEKPGKEIELAWLKTVVAYLNTDGGLLLIGVQDDGNVLGLQADKFRNDDKLLLHFDNLIKQHVGLEFAPYIDAKLMSAGDEQVLMVNCDRCDEPAFLINGEDESFYIRIGPSTRLLPTSKIMDYLRERQA